MYRDERVSHEGSIASATTEAEGLRHQIRRLEARLLLLEAEEEDDALDLEGWEALQEIRATLPGLRLVAQGRRRPYPA